jgi:UDPglucose--hexose-1-phosphate uridylyltransferase
MPNASIPTCPAFPFSDPNASHLVHDELTHDWVILAPGRRYRPDATRGKMKKIADPFSPQGLKSEHVLATIGRGANRVVAVENRFPVFHHKKGLVGRQEILAEGMAKQSFTKFSEAGIATAVEAWAKRMGEFRKDPLIQYIQFLKNEGHEAGASQPHPHSQLFGLHFVPERIRLMEKARKKMGSLEQVHAHILREATPARTIYQDSKVIAFANPTARFPYEVRILTRRAIDHLSAASPAELKSVANALFALFPLVRKSGWSFNLFCHDVTGDMNEPFEMRFAPRMSYWGGFELDAGIIVNPVPAECAAEEYRAEIKKT